MRIKLVTTLLVLVLSIAMVSLGSASDIGTLGHFDDHSKPGGQGKPWDHGKPDDHWKDHSKGTLIVTVIEKNGRPASDSSVIMDGHFVGSTNHQGMLTIRNVSPGEHKISANENNRHSRLYGSTQIRVRGGQTIQATIQLRSWR